MAYITTAARPSVADRLHALLQRYRAARARRAVYTRTLNELSALSDRDLEDLGISRHNIEDIAWSHAYPA